MIFLLQLVLYVIIGVSNICLGMNQQGWEIGRVTDYAYNDTKVRSGNLEIYYDGNKNYEQCARFKSETDTIKLTNFDQEYRDILEGIKKNGADPLIWKKNGTKEEALKIKKIKNTQECLELLNIPEECKVVLKRDNILLDTLKIYHAENIEIIRQTLSLNKPFIINFSNIPSCDQVKVKVYKNESYIYWKEWTPLLSSQDVGSFGLGHCLDKPQTIDIDLNKEQEALYYFRRNKWISRLSVLALFAVIAYQLKNKIYNVGSLLLQ